MNISVGLKDGEMELKLMMGKDIGMSVSVHLSKLEKWKKTQETDL